MREAVQVWLVVEVGGNIYGMHCCGGNYFVSNIKESMGAIEKGNLWCHVGWLGSQAC